MRQKKSETREGTESHLGAPRVQKVIAGCCKYKGSTVSTSQQTNLGRIVHMGSKTMGM